MEVTMDCDGVRLRGYLIHSIEKFKYFGTVLQENEGVIVENVASGLVKYRDRSLVWRNKVIEGKREIV